MTKITTACRRVTWTLIGALVSFGCAATNLEAPANHPGHPDASAAKVTRSTPLGQGVAPSAKQETSQPSGHEHHAEEKK